MKDVYPEMIIKVYQERINFQISEQLKKIDEVAGSSFLIMHKDTLDPGQCYILKNWISKHLKDRLSDDLESFYIRILVALEKRVALKSGLTIIFDIN